MANNSSDKPLTPLDTTNPATAAANPNLTQKQVDMAATPASKQGIAGIESPFTNKGNVHVPPSADTIFKTSTPPTSEVKPAKEAGITDTERAGQLKTQRDVVEADRRAAQERLAAGRSVSGVGGLAASIQNQLASNIDRIFSDKSQALTGSSLADIAGSSALRGGMVISDEIKAPVNAALDKIYAADKTLDDLTEAKAGTPEYTAATAAMTASVAELATAMGSTTGKIDWNTVKGYFPDTEKLMGVLASSALADQVTVDSQMLNDMGYDTDAEKVEITKLLGLTGKESVTEFRNKVESYLTTEYQDVTKLERDLRDVTLTPEERAETLERLRDLGYTGSLASREEVTDAVNQIKDIADQEFDFAGQKMTMEDALSDAGVTGAVSDYLSGKIKREDLPDALADFVDKNKGLFEGAISELKEEIGTYNTIQDEWGSLKALQLDSEVLKSLGYNPDLPFQTTKLNTDGMPLVKAIVTGKDSEGNPVNVAKYTTLLSNLNKYSPATMTQVLSTLKSADIKKLTEDDNLMRSYTSSLGAVQNLGGLRARLDDQDAGNNPFSEEMLSLIYGGNSDITELGEMVDTIQSLKEAGITKFDGVLTSLLAVADVDNPHALLDQLEKSIGTTVTSLDDFANNLKDGISKFTSAVGSAKEIKDWKTLATELKSGTAASIYEAATARGVIDPRASIAEQMTQARKLSKDKGPQIEQQIFSRAFEGADAVFSAQQAGATHWASDESKKAAASAIGGLTEMLTVSAGSLSPEARALASAKLKEYSKVFTEKRIGLKWQDVLNISKELEGWTPPVSVPGFEGIAVKGDALTAEGTRMEQGTFIPVKGTSAGYNAASQQFVEAVTDYARLNGLPLNKATADQFAIFMHLASSGGTRPDDVQKQVASGVKNLATLIRKN